VVDTRVLHGSGPGESAQAGWSPTRDFSANLRIGYPRRIEGKTPLGVVDAVPHTYQITLQHEVTYIIVM